MGRPLVMLAILACLFAPRALFAQSQGDREPESRSEGGQGGVVETVVVVPEDEDVDADQDDETTDGAPEDDSTNDSETILLPTIENEAERGEPDEESPAETSERVDAETIDRRASWRLDEALSWLVGAQPVEQTSTGTGMIVEGLPASQLEVMSDGLPVSRPVGGPDGPATDLSAQDLSTQTIESLELHRGLGPLGSGPASGVVVSVDRGFLSEGTRASVRGSGQSAPMMLGQTPYRALRGAIAGHHGFESGWALGLEAGIDQRAPVDVNGDETMDLPTRELYRGTLRTQWKKQDDQGLRLRADYDQSGVDAPIGPNAQLQDVVRTRRGAFGARGKWRPATLWTVEHKSQFDVYEHRFSKRVLQSDFLRLKSETTQFRTVHDVSATRLTGLHELGAELYGSLERIERAGETGDLEPVDRIHLGLSLADTWMPTEDIEVRARAWGDYHNDFGPSYMADLSAGWQITDAVLVRASGSRTRRLPTAEEMFLFFDHSEVGYQVQGNAELDPETMISARAGTAIGSDDWPARFELDGYVHYLDDLITTVDSGDSSGSIPVFTYDNLSKARTAGLQARVVSEALVGELDIRASYSYLPLAEDIETGERLDLRTRHQATAEFVYGWLEDDLETWVDLRTRSALEVPEGSPAAPAYLLLGVGARWSPDDSLGIAVDLDNLLNQTNATWGPKPGLTAMLSISYDYQSNARTR